MLVSAYKKGSNTTTFGCILLPNLYVPMYKCNIVAKIILKYFNSFALCIVYCCIFV